MDADSFIIHVKTEDVYKDIAKEFKARFDTSNYEIDWPLPMGTNEKVSGLMKHELGGQIMKTFVVFRVKTCSYLKDNDDEYKNAKVVQKCAIKKT